MVLQNRFWYYIIEFGTDRFDFGSTTSTQDQFWGFMASPPGPLGRVPGAKSGPKGASRGGLIQRIWSPKMGHEEQEAGRPKKEVAKSSKIGVIKL